MCVCLSALSRQNCAHAHAQNSAHNAHVFMCRIPCMRLQTSRMQNMHASANRFSTREVQQHFSVFVMPVGSVHYFLRIKKSEQCSDLGGWVGHGKMDVRISSEKISSGPQVSNFHLPPDN